MKTQMHNAYALICTMIVVGTISSVTMSVGNASPSNVAQSFVGTTPDTTADETPTATF
jgi:hypothetical protein